MSNIRQDVVRHNVQAHHTRGESVVPASSTEAKVPDLDPGRYVFRVKAVSRGGAGPWARSIAVYVE
ncbi:fibronectin type III domain-containing protein [Nocardioides sp.]|uniref:fibronectin type III domain-containing protein n=1 Tax=Nocardioides sp. TaxID=35761 RepID=UPI002CAB9B0D|nr:hypothetical protein [Nocardioides sp.]HXH78815.1 hypothetical protein [Nocardioides sp.]